MTYSVNQKVVFDPSNMSAFGTLEADPLDPILQVDFVYGINTQIGVSTTANSATVDYNAARLRLQAGTNSAGSAIYNSRRPAKYRPGQGITTRFTCVFTNNAASNTQGYGMGNATDGYFFGYNGTAFGINYRYNGSDGWVAQTAWNVDKCNGTGASGFTINPAYGNVYMIKYPYLGYGNIEFFILSPTTGRWILCHVIWYANTSASTQLTNPNLFFWGWSINAGSTTNVLNYCACYAVFSSGHREFISCPRWAMDSNKAAITTENALLSIRNATSYNGITNRSLIRLNSVTVAMKSNGATDVGCVRFKTGVTLGGSPSWSMISGSSADSGVTITAGNSIASYDVAGNTISGGTYVFNISIGSGCTQAVDLTPFELFIAPAEIMTVSAYATGSSSFGVSLNWSEDI